MRAPPLVPRPLAAAAVAAVFALCSTGAGQVPAAGTGNIMAVPVPQPGAPAPVRYMSAVAGNDSRGFVFGGEDSAGVFSSELWAFDADGDGWQELLGTSAEGGDLAGSYGSLGVVNIPPHEEPARPGSRIGSCIAAIGSRLFMFGGFGYGHNATATAYGPPARGYLSDMWLFEAGAWTWWGGSSSVDEKPCMLSEGCQDRLCPRWKQQTQKYELLPCSWPGGRQGAATWVDSSRRIADRLDTALDNSDFEADTELTAELNGFAYTAPTGWAGGGSNFGAVVVVEDGIFRWGAAQSTTGGGGFFVALVGPQAFITQDITGLSAGTYLLQFRAASGFEDGDVLRVLIDGVPMWEGQPPDDAFRPEEFRFMSSSDAPRTLTFQTVGASPGLAVFVDDVVLSRIYVSELVLLA